MNLELMGDHIRFYNQEVIESGLKRDIDDYITSLPAHQSNILTLREIANNVYKSIHGIYQGDLPDILEALFPGGEPRPFTETFHQATLKEIIDDPKIPIPEFFQRLTQCLNQLKGQLDSNQKKINQISGFIDPYITDKPQSGPKEGLATISIVFRDNVTISSLKKFSRALSDWDKVLLMYHQLLKSDSPEPVQIVEVQNGSIDLVVNLNLDVALDLVELFKLGFRVFGAYLGYQKLVVPLTEFYHGNEELIEMDSKKEKLLLDNIGKAVTKEIQSQHEAAKGENREINGESVDRKVTAVSELVTSHIVRGNDLKLLTMTPGGEDEDFQEELEDNRESLRVSSQDARKKLKEMPGEVHQKLLDSYRGPREIEG